MRLVIPRCEVVTDEAGWTWLQPVERSTRARHTAGTFVLAVLILAGMATWTLLTRPSAYLATAAVVALAVWLFAAIARGARSRLAWSAVGIYVQNGGHAEQLAWSALRGVTTKPVGRRLRIVVDDGYRTITTSADFDRACVTDWLTSLQAEAAHRRLGPVAAADGPGFTTG